MFLDLDSPVVNTKPATGTCRKCGACVRLSYCNNKAGISGHFGQSKHRPFGRCEGTFRPPQ